MTGPKGHWHTAERTIDTDGHHWTIGLTPTTGGAVALILWSDDVVATHLRGPEPDMVRTAHRWATNLLNGRPWMSATSQIQLREPIGGRAPTLRRRVELVRRAAVVRQLLIAPARQRELFDGLPGVATNLLTDRLCDLEIAGVVERRLAEGSNAIMYAITLWGTELVEPMESLIRWSTPLRARGS